MKKLICIFTATLPLVLFSQSPPPGKSYRDSRRKTCNKKPELEDLNAISTKCKLSPSSSGKHGNINVTVSSSKKRYRKQGTKSKFVATKRESKTMSKVFLRTKFKEARRFSDVDQIPAFKKCKNMLGDKRVNCFNQEMIQHIQDHFHYPEEAVVKKIQGKVHVSFIVNSRGKVEYINARVTGKNRKSMKSQDKKILEEEAIRVVSNLSKFDPAIKKGRPVSTKYGFPINFSLQD